MAVVLFTDGGARGNPGPAALGAVLVRDGEVMAEVGRYLGATTNNVAEWAALIAGLERALELGIDDLSVRMDSELVVKQLSGEYRVKDAKLQPLHGQAKSLLRRFKRVDIAHVRRNENKLADAVVNRVLDAERAAGAAESLPLMGSRGDDARA